MACPIPLMRLADQVPEITQHHEWAAHQAEYGLPMHEWVENEPQAQAMLDRWWDALPRKEQAEWIRRYRQELEAEVMRWQATIDRLEAQAEALDDLVPYYTAQHRYADDVRWHGAEPRPYAQLYLHQTLANVRESCQRTQNTCEVRVVEYVPQIVQRWQVDTDGKVQPLDQPAPTKAEDDHAQ